MKKGLVLVASVGIIISWYACQPEQGQLQSLTLDLPETPHVYAVGANDEVPTLGRVLFYDPKLSINNSISCSSCHKQTLAFADNTQFSTGFENKKTSRNSMPIQNLSPSGFFRMGTGGGFFDSLSTNIGTLFWDGRESDLKQMVLQPIANHVEMGVFDFDMIIKKLQALPYYEELFRKAYGESEITKDKIADALSFFLMSIRSVNTKFDRVMRKETSFTATELAGMQLFITTYDCNSCHQVQDPIGYLFAGGFANIGLDNNYADQGLAQTTNRPSDNGKFKIPSLRNVVLTAPYMHDGRFSTLEEVMGHYSEGLSNHPNLDFRLRNFSNEAKVMNIPDADKKAIITFLNTLTDVTMISDPKFSNPFKAQ